MRTLNRERRTSSSTWFKRPSRLLSLFSGGLARRRRAPEQCALRDRPGSPPADVSHRRLPSILGQGKHYHRLPPRNAAFAAGRARMHGSGMQASACDLQSKIRLFGGTLRHFFDPTGQILMSNSAGGSRRIFVWLASSLVRSIHCFLTAAGRSPPGRRSQWRRDGTVQ